MTAKGVLATAAKAAATAVAATMAKAVILSRIIVPVALYVSTTFGVEWGGGDKTSNKVGRIHAYQVTSKDVWRALRKISHRAGAPPEAKD